METKQVKTANPTPEQRPDLYDDYDFSDRPLGQPTGVKIPDYLQKMLDEREGQQQKPQPLQAAE